QCDVNRASPSVVIIGNWLGNGRASTVDCQLEICSALDAAGCRIDWRGFLETENRGRYDAPGLSSLTASASLVLPHEDPRISGKTASGGGGSAGSQRNRRPYT